MFAQFSKKTIFLKFISGIVLFSFIFTGIPGKGYAGAGVFDNLRKPSAEKDGGTEDIINDFEKIKEQKDRGREEKRVIDQRPIWEKELTTKMK